MGTYGPRASALTQNDAQQEKSKPWGGSDPRGMGPAGCSSIWSRSQPQVPAGSGPLPGCPGCQLGSPPARSTQRCPRRSHQPSAGRRSGPSQTARPWSRRCTCRGRSCCQPGGDMPGTAQGVTALSPQLCARAAPHLSQPFTTAFRRRTRPCRQPGQRGWCGGHPPPQLPAGLWVRRAGRGGSGGCAKALGDLARLCQGGSESRDAQRPRAHPVPLAPLA